MKYLCILLLAIALLGCVKLVKQMPDSNSPTSPNIQAAPTSAAVPDPETRATGTPIPVPPTEALTSTPAPASATSPPATVPLSRETPTVAPPPATPTAVPASPTNAPTAAPKVGPVKASEGSITIPTYQYQAALEADPRGSFHPYKRLDFSRIGGPLSKPYRTLILENPYLKITVLPDLGGRIYNAVFKPTGHNIFYQNPVIKPSHFGYRGWWLATGGMEFTLPTEEHGLNEYVPWKANLSEYPDGSASVVVSDLEETTKTKVTVEIKLAPDSASFSLETRLENTSSKATNIQYWINAMLAPGGTNSVSPRTEFVFPSAEMTVHSTGDPDLPQAHGTLRWPVHNGRDLSLFANWRSYLGLFAKDVGAGFAGAYNHDADEGVVRVFSGGARGAKLFAFGRSFDTSTYTDDGSSYFEIWGGLTPTFWDFYSLQPGQSAGWKEFWYPVAKIGGLKHANEEAALAFSLAGPSSLHIGLMPSRPLAGRISVAYDGEVVHQGAIDLSPAAPLNLNLSLPLRRDGVVEVHVVDTGEREVVQYRGLP